jgi:rod shape-determining protein MreB
LPRREFAVDPGSFNTVVAGRRAARPLRELSCVVVAPGKVPGMGGGRMLAWGGASRALPAAAREAGTRLPVRRGRMADPIPLHMLLRAVLRKAGARSLLTRLTGARVAMVLAPHLNAAERSDFLELGQEVARATALPVEAAFAAARGLGLDVSGNQAHLILDVGGGKTYAALLAWGDVVSLGHADFGGQDLDLALQRFVEDRYFIRLALEQAEDIKASAGSVFPRKQHGTVPLSGVDRRTGFEKKVLLDDNDLRDVLADACEPLIAVLQSCLMGMPPELAGDVAERGVTLLGGGALIYGLPEFLHERLRMRFQLAHDPINATIRGAQALLLEGRAG